METWILAAGVESLVEIKLKLKKKKKKPLAELSKLEAIWCGASCCASVGHSWCCVALVSVRGAALQEDFPGRNCAACVPREQAAGSPCSWRARGLLHSPEDASAVCLINSTRAAAILIIKHLSYYWQEKAA